MGTGEWMVPAPSVPPRLVEQTFRIPVGTVDYRYRVGKSIYPVPAPGIYEELGLNKGDAWNTFPSEYCTVPQNTGASPLPSQNTGATPLPSQMHCSSAWHTWSYTSHTRVQWDMHVGIYKG